MSGNEFMLLIKPHASDPKTIAHQLSRAVITREAYETLPDDSGFDTAGVLRKALIDGCNYLIDFDGTFYNVEFCIYRRED